MKKNIIAILFNTFLLIAFSQNSVNQRKESYYKKEVVYISMLNTTNKEWIAEFNIIKSAFQDAESAKKRIELNNKKLSEYEEVCKKSNGYKCSQYSIEEYNLFRESDMFQISEKSVIKKLVKLTNLGSLKKEIDFSLAYGVKDVNSGLGHLYLKVYNHWKQYTISTNDQKATSMRILLLNNILPMSETTKVSALKLLTGLDDNYFIYFFEKFEDDSKVNFFNRTFTQIENSNYNFLGSFNNDGTKKWGILFDEDKDTLFIGKWKNDFPDLENGKTFLYANSEDIVILEKNGMVFKTYVGGRIIYVGAMSSNGANGYGTSIMKNGDRYVGNRVNGELSGRGIMKYRSGGYYEGEWENNKKNGMGVYVSSTGVKQEGLFQDDSFIKSNVELQQERIAEQNKNNDWIFLEEESQNTISDSFSPAVYGQTVTIGTQVWDAKNLDVSTFRNGDIIPEAKTSEEWEKAGLRNQAAWCYYGNDQANGKIYGKLYNWYAVNDPRGLAPIGYHIPSDTEWKTLHDYINSFDKKSMKSTSGWNSITSGGSKTCPNCSSWNAEYRKKVPCHTCKDTRSVPAPKVTHSQNGTNSSGFSALPGGCRFDFGVFSMVGDDAFWWCSTGYATYQAQFSTLNRIDNESKKCGYSVRCISD